MATGNKEPILNDNVVDHKEKLPKALSPSRANDYITCPRMFYYKTILGLPTPPTVATLKGNLVHTVAEDLYDLPEGEQTLENAVAAVEPTWQKTREEAGKPGNRNNPEQIEQLVPAGSDIEKTMLADATKAIENWFALENVKAADPKKTTLPNETTVDGREVHIEGKAGTVNIHGFIDRLNSYPDKVNGETRWSISDYKTGKRPGPRYEDKAFFQLRVYAVAFTNTYGKHPNWLRLIYLSTDKKEKGIMQIPVTRRVLEKTEKQIVALWKNIEKSATTRVWQTQTGPLCNYCYFQPSCPAWSKTIDDLPDEEQQTK